ncbi:MAG TPA: biotin transporter BioY [Bauldia sp.]|nr:biotin transporter BioY [Bauldia sp.]
MQPTALALAPALWPERVSRALQVVLLVLAGTALLTVSAKVKVWQEPVPITLQTLAVMLISAAYGSRLAVATVLAYLLEGALGLPVFTNTPPMIAGPAYFLGTTGGFLVGFIPLAFIVGYAADRGWDRSAVKLFGAMVAADIVVFAIGLAWLAWGTPLSPGLAKLLGAAAGTHGTGIAFAWAKGVAPFVVADLLKIALAAALVPASWALIAPRRN